MFCMFSSKNSFLIFIQGGIYLFELADWYILTYALLFGSSLEAFMVCWIYGLYFFCAVTKTSLIGLTNMKTTLLY